MSRTLRFAGSFLMLSLAPWLAGNMPLSAASNTWSLAENMAVARSAACAVLLQDGRVLISGGEGSSGVMASAELLNIASGVSDVAPMASLRAGHACATLPDGSVLVAGGRTNGGGATNTAEIYNPSTNSWRFADSMIAARAGATASVLKDGRVLIAGGESSGEAVVTLEIYDALGGKFMPVSQPLSSPRKDHAAAVLGDGRVVIAGGSNGSVLLDTVDIFDPATGEVSAIGKLSAPRAGLTATTLLNGRVFFAGGNNGDGDLASTEILDPATGAFTPGAAMDTPRRGHVAFRIPNNNSVLIAGGTSAGKPTVAAGLYIPWTNSYRSGAPLSVGRSAVAATTLKAKGAVMLAGGSMRDATTTQTVEVTAVPTIITNQLDYAPGEIVDITGANWTPGATVSLSVTRVADNTQRWGPTEVIADATGNVSAQFTITEADLNLTFALTATEPVSGKTAQVWTFTDAEAATSEVTGITNDVTMVQGAGAVSSNIAVTASGNISSLITSSTPATFKVDAVYSYAAGALSSNTPSAALNFFAGSIGCNGGNCDVTWTGAPTPYSIAASFNADASTPANNYTITLSSSAGTTILTNPSVSGGKLADATATPLTVHVRLAAPTNLTATAASQTQINLSWTDSSTGETGFAIEASSDGSAFTPLATLGAGIGSYNHTGLTCGTTRYYRVKAYKTSPAGLDSDYSVTASAMTTACDSTPPVITPTVTGTLGNNGWYVSDVSISWSVSDAESAVTSQSGCDAVSITTDTAGQTFSCSATSAGGTASKSVIIKRDAAPPTVSATPDRAPDSNGWYNHGFSVHFSGTDAGSGIDAATCTAAVSYSGPETGSGSIPGSCKDAAGNQASATFSFKYDATPPTVTATPDRGPDSNGWYNHAFSVTFAGSDAGSGIDAATCTAQVSYSGPDTGTGSIPGSCKDAAGNQASATFSFKYDATPPAVTPSPDRAPDSNGWYNHAFSVTFSGTDGFSGMDASTCTAVNYSGPDTGSGSIPGSCKDVAGNQAGAAFSVKYDATVPVLAPVVTGTKGTSDWYTSGATISAGGSDDVSGIASSSCTPASLTADNTGTAVNCTATNGAGLSNSASLTVKIDTSPPVLSPSISGTLGQNGWYTSDVAIAAGAGDTISGIASQNCSPGLLTANTSGTAVSCSATNGAGLTSTSAPITIKIDKTPPVITPTITGTLGQNGWYTTNVTVSWSVHDPESDIAISTGCASTVVSADTAGQILTCTATNGAGASVSQAVTIQRDATPPVVIPAVLGTAGSNAWYTTDVTINPGASDDVSGIASGSCTPASLSANTPGTVVTCTATNNAGLQNSASITVKIDKTAPMITPNVVGTPGNNGWYVSNVTVNWTVGDGDSGIGSQTGCAITTILTDTAGQTLTCTAINGAGTSASQSVVIKRDTTRPVLNALGNGGAYAAGTWTNQDVSVVFTCGDATSGVNVYAPVAPVGISAEGTTSVPGSCADNAGNAASGVFVAMIDKQAPSVANVSVTANPLPVNTTGTISGLAGTVETDRAYIISAEYSIDGGPPMPMNAVNAPWDSTQEAVTAAKQFTTPDVVQVCVRATDAAGNTGDWACLLLAVYDPNGGFVTGGGWISSPVIPALPYMQVAGKANFGFVSKYQKGQSTPSGNTEFQFKEGNFDFHGTAFQWLVVSGPKAQFKGTGTVNGSGNYGFMITATDGEVSGGGGVDKFRIKVWDINNGGATVYDNVYGSPDDIDTANPQALGGGSIVIHSK